LQTLAGIELFGRLFGTTINFVSGTLFFSITIAERTHADEAAHEKTKDSLR